MVPAMKPDPIVSEYLSKIGKKGGSRNTPDQDRARRTNGKKGGRPKGAKDSKPRKRKP